MIVVQVDSVNKKRLWISVDAGHPLKEKIWFPRDCASEIEAALLEKQIDGKLNATAEEIRKVSYSTGWRDAKSKKRTKRTWFVMCLNVLDWERKDAGL